MTVIAHGLKVLIGIRASVLQLDDMVTLEGGRQYHIAHIASILRLVGYLDTMGGRICALPSLKRTYPLPYG